MVRERSNTRAAHRRVQPRSGIGATRSTPFRLLCSFRRAGERSSKMFGGGIDVAHCCCRHGLQSMTVILDFAQKFCHSVQPGRTPSLLSYLEASRRICGGKQQTKAGARRRRTANYDCCGYETRWNVISQQRCRQMKCDAM